MFKLTSKEVERYDIGKAILALSSGRRQGFEFEIDESLRREFFACAAGESDSVSRRVPATLGRLIIPNEVVVHYAQRDMTVAASAAGGFLVGTDNVGLIDLLANRSVILRLGARRMPGLRGNVTLPKQTGGATAYWIASEGTPITESQPTFAQIALAPKMVGAYTEISRQLLLQSAPAVNGVVANELTRRVALAIDKAAIDGSGAGGQPTGILNVAGVGAFTGTSLGIDDLLDAQGDLAAANVDLAGASYCTTAAVAALLMQRQRFTGTDSPLWVGSMVDGRVMGLRAIASNQMPSATVICGNWSHCIVGEWGAPIEIEVNPYAAFASGTIGVRALALVDIAFEHPTAFSVATGVT